MREEIEGVLAGADAALLERLVTGSARHATRRIGEVADARELLAELGVEPRVTAAAGGLAGATRERERPGHIALRSGRWRTDWRQSCLERRLESRPHELASWAIRLRDAARRHHLGRPAAEPAPGRGRAERDLRAQPRRGPHRAGASRAGRAGLPRAPPRRQGPPRHRARGGRDRRGARGAREPGGAQRRAQRDEGRCRRAPRPAAGDEVVAEGRGPPEGVRRQRPPAPSAARDLPQPDGHPAHLDAELPARALPVPHDPRPGPGPAVAGGAHRRRRRRRRARSRRRRAGDAHAPAACRRDGPCRGRGARRRPARPGRRGGSRPPSPGGGLRPGHRGKESAVGGAAGGQPCWSALVRAARAALCIHMVHFAARAFSLARWRSISTGAERSRPAARSARYQRAAPPQAPRRAPSPRCPGRALSRAPRGRGRAATRAHDVSAPSRRRPPRPAPAPRPGACSPPPSCARRPR